MFVMYALFFMISVPILCVQTLLTFLFGFLLALGALVIVFIALARQAYSLDLISDADLLGILGMMSQWFGKCISLADQIFKRFLIGLGLLIFNGPRMAKDKSGVESQSPPSQHQVVQAITAAAASG